MTNNRKARYFTYVGSHDGAIRMGQHWVRAKSLNRIDKSGMIRWQGVPSEALDRALNDPVVVEAVALIPGRRIKKGG